MSPRPKQTSMVKKSSRDQGSRQSSPQQIPRTSSTSVSLASTSYTSDMSAYSSRSRSETIQSDDSAMWSATFPGQFPGNEDIPHFDAMHMDSVTIPDHAYMLPVMTTGSCFNTTSYDHFSQGPMSQTLTAPLLDPSYPDMMLGDDLMQASPISMDIPTYGTSSQHTWRHGQLSPPAEIFHAELNEFTMDPACDTPFQPLPESATPGAFAYDKISASAPRLGQPRPIRSASERSALSQITMAPQDIQFSKHDRHDRLRARNDPRYDAGADKDGYYHCPMLNEGTCNHKPTKQKCIYAKYLDSHLKPYVCTHGEKGSECDGARFSSNACLFRHEREAHGMHNHGLNPYPCLFQGCERSRPGNGFPRRWNQRDHMKRVHDWEDLEAAGYENQDRNGPLEPTKRRSRLGSSNSVPMKRSSSSQNKAQSSNYAHGSRNSVNMSRFAAQVEKQLQADMMPYPVHFNDVSYSQVSTYQPQPRTSEAYPNSYLVAY